MKTNDTTQLVAYARHLEEEVAILRADLARARADAERLRKLRIKDREIAAHYRAIVEGDVA